MRTDAVLLLTCAACAVLSAGCASPRPQQDDRLAASRSPHGAIAVDCARCHQPSAWSPLREPLDFDHAQQTPFALSGAHEGVDCRACHIALRFDEPGAGATDCAACHVDVHSGRLGTRCTECHDTHSFTGGARRDAHVGTAFPLTGRHRQVECEACHGAGGGERYQALATECLSCHAAQYGSATPDHSGFPETCGGCHGTLTWRGARFDHASAAGYPLEGAHNRSDCSSCHVPPDFTLRYTATGPRDCIACHRDDYDREHAGLGFAEDCLVCHSQETFRGARWLEHEARFPIYSGSHARRWSSCGQCHDSPGFATVSCLNCHEHSQSRMDDKHRERSGYSYTTAACLSCHPRGAAE